MTRYPLCKQLGVLRFDHTGRAIVSTSALEAAIGSERYQRACESFNYITYHPSAASVETFLRSERNIGK